MTTGELIRKLNPRGEYSRIVKFNPNGKQTLITTTKVASLYDTATWKPHNLDLGKPANEKPDKGSNPMFFTIALVVSRNLRPLYTLFRFGS